MVLSDEQKAAVNSDSNLICILACAGSGKTTTLTNRIARFINSGLVDPSGIVAITFTVLAGEYLKHEIAQLAKDKSAVSRMFIGTIHSFCFHLLQTERIVSTESILPITDGQKFVLMSKNWSTWEIEKVAPSLSKTKLIESLIMSFDIIKMNSIDMGKLTASHVELARVYQLYDDYLKNAGFVDFANMLVSARDLLKNNREVRNRVLDRYPYIFIDEYQDVDPVQANLVDIFQQRSHVCVVGDDDQAIYQFRGADERNIQAFAKQSTCELLLLSENRRCPKNILSVGEKCISKITKRLSKSMFTNIPNGIVSCRYFETLKDELDFLSSEIVRLKLSGLIKSYGQVGILLRSLVSSGAAYMDILKSCGIPFVARGAKALFNSPEITELISIIEWFAKDEDSIANLELLAPIMKGPLNLETLARFADRSSLLRETDWTNAGMKSEDWGTLCELHKLRTRYEERKFGSLLELIHDFIEVLGLMAPERDEPGKYNVAQFTRIVDEYETIQDNRNFRSLGAFLSAYAQRTYDEDTPIEKFDDAVNVLTVHQAKGLEFDYVFIPMLIEKRFPLESTQRRWLIDDTLFDAARYLTSIENERRLYYVACTRAKRALYLLASENIGLKRPRIPSKFWDESHRVKLSDANIEPPGKAIRKDKKRRFTAGYSSLEYYLTCPYRYKLVVEYGLMFPQVVYFQFGKLMHDVFAYINSAWKQGSSISSEKASIFFEEKFPLYYKNTNMREYDIRKQLFRGKKIIDSFFKNKQTWYENVYDLEKDFSFFSDLALVRGRYDVILGNPRGKFTIMDYKTGRAHAGLRPDFQMQFYSIAAITQLNLEVDEAIIYYIEDENLVRYQATPDFLKAGDTNLMMTIGGIINKDFHATPNKDVCSQCEVKKICPSRFTN